MHSKNVNRPHLRAAFVAVIFFLLAAMGSDGGAEWVETGYIRALAPLLFEQKNQGSVLQRIAFQQSDLLPLYGSSELIDPDYPGIFRAADVFRNYPTGFAIFPVGTVGAASLTYAESLAGVGSEMRGKKVAISISPPWFFRYYTAPLSRTQYEGNFSRVHAHELAFSLDLSFDLKKAFAGRMLQYPNTLSRDPLLHFALEKLDEGTLPSHMLYYAVLPLGLLQNWAFRLQDHQATLEFIYEHRDLQAPPKQPQVIDWQARRDRAEQESIIMSDNNPMGYDNRAWDSGPPKLSQPGGAFVSPEAFIKTVPQTTEWTDLELLLRELKELGAEPIILSQPIKGVYFDSIGIPASARKVYYDKLEALTARHGTPVFDFADHDGDKYFDTDQFSHLSPLGWIYFDQVLDGFYHEAP